MKAIYFDINPIYLQRIEKMIRESDIITTIWPVDTFDRYSLGAYVRETYIEKNKFFALLDRNIYTDIISVAKSIGTKQHTSQQKVACALLAFLQLADVTIEPNMAVNEYVDSGHYDEAVPELSLFRAIDNLDPKILIELALGQKNEIPSSMINCIAEESFELKKGENFINWKIHYGFVLKLAIIELQGGKPVEKLYRLLDWVYKKYIFIGSAIIFGLVYFSEKRLKGMIKHIGSGDKDNILRGIRNTTWDMTISHYWAKKAIIDKENGVFWLLCTADKALKTVADNIVVTNEFPGEIEQKKKALFCNYLGDEKGIQIHDMLIDMEKRLSDSSRVAYNLGHLSNLYPVIDDLENQLLSMLIKHNCIN